MSDKLKPCPFCGEEAILSETNNNKAFVMCCNCYAQTGVFYKESMAMDAWNRRVEPTFTPDELDAIRRNVSDWRAERELPEIEQSIIDKCANALKGGKR